MSHRSFRYKIFPTKEQSEILVSFLHIACDLYNHALQYREKYWHESRRPTDFYRLSKLLTVWRNESPETNPLQTWNATAEHQVLRRLHRNYQHFFKRGARIPKRQDYENYTSIDYKYGNGCKIKGDKLYIQNVGLINVSWYRELPEGTIKNINISHKAMGWYVYFGIDLPASPAPEPSTNPAVGIDVGILHALALSNGIFIDSPRYLEQSLKKLRRLQRSVDRKQKGSNRWKKAKRLLARQHEHIANQRQDFWHKTTRHLVSTYGTIVLEDMGLRFMLVDRRFARIAYDTGLGLFRRYLTYKAEDEGVTVAYVDPRCTSQLCSNCGKLVPKTLRDRTHRCPYCFLEIDRDVNAAINILNRLEHRPSDANA